MQDIENHSSNPTSHAEPVIPATLQVEEPWLEPSADRSETRVFSAQRMKYSAEVKLIQNQHGDLEAMRRTLGLSQRKMAQLLLVDPSAWTRWTRPNGNPPPHIFRALSWFLLLQEKAPGMTPYHWLQTVARPAVPAQEMTSLKNRVALEISRQFEDRLAHRERWLKILILANVVLFLIVLYSLFK